MVLSSINGVTSPSRSYKVAFRAGDANQRKNHTDFRFIMPISIGQRVHEGGKMQATFAFVERHFPKGGCILVDDVIQRYTKKILDPSVSDGEIWTSCLEEGKVWIERYRQDYEHLLDKGWQVVRWADWLNHDEFVSMLELVQKTRLMDPIYKEAFEETIDGFVGRLTRRTPGIDTVFARKQCLDYLEEECAAMMLWPTLGVDIEVYPSERNQAMKATNSLLLEPHYGKALFHAGLRFHAK